MLSKKFLCAWLRQANNQMGPRSMSQQPDGPTPLNVYMHSLLVFCIYLAMGPIPSSHESGMNLWKPFCQTVKASVVPWRSIEPKSVDIYGCSNIFFGQC